MRIAALILAAILTLGVLWNAGEQHRESCLREGLRGCNVLPWSGHRPPPLPARSDTRSERERRIDEALDTLSEQDRRIDEALEQLP